MTYIHTTKAMYNHILHRYVDNSLQKLRLLVLALLTLAILNKTNLTLSDVHCLILPLDFWTSLRLQNV